VRLGLAAVGILLAVAAVGRYRALDKERRDLTAWLETSGQPIDPRLARELARELDVNGLAVRAVRASLAREIWALAHADSPAIEAERLPRAARLAETAQRAGAALADSPASWEAAMVLGAATYMSESQARDSRLFTDHERWEEPLQAAIRLAPAKREPLRFLTTAYLEIWPALTVPKRAATRRMVAEMMRDPEDLRSILGSWFAVAGRGKEALSVLPPDPRAWEQVQSILASQSDWEGFSGARQQWDHILGAQLRSMVAAADAELAQGEPRNARDLYIAALKLVRPDIGDRDVLEAALIHCPPGPMSRDTAKHLTRLLDWSLERCQVAACPLSPPALERLARFAGETAAPREAMAVLLSGDLPGAVAVERRSGAVWNDAWTPYLVAKARALARRGRLSEAATALDLVPRGWWERPAYWQARLELARAADDAAGAARAENSLRGMTRRAWPATVWTWRAERAQMEMLIDAPAQGVTIGLDEVPPAGAVVELRLDGVLRGLLTAQPAGSLTTDGALGPGTHVLEVESIAGGRVVPGAVRLR